MVQGSEVPPAVFQAMGGQAGLKGSDVRDSARF